jgi:hypothetical protein
LCALAARRRRSADVVPGVFLAAGLLQCYLLFWLTSAQKGVFLLGDGRLDPWWVTAAVPLLLAQLVLLASLYRSLREKSRPGSQRAGWMSLYFAAAVVILALAYRVAGAPLLAPAMLWLSLYLVLWVGLCWLLLRRLPGEEAA